MNQGRHVKIGLAQLTRKLGDKHENVARGSAFVREAAEKGATLVILPELFNTGMVATDVYDQERLGWAETTDGESISAMCALAQELSVAIIAPIFEFEPEGTMWFNTAVVIDETGQVVGKYRKRHIPIIPRQLEKAYFSPGDIFYRVFDVAGCKLGVLICYDRHFPESFRHLALQGAEVVAVVSNTPTEFSGKNWIPEMHVNAVANGCFIVQVNASGKEEDIPWFGRSAVVSPRGDVLLEMGSEPGVEVVELPLGEIEIVRRHYATLRDVRAEDFVGSVPELPRHAEQAATPGKASRG
ncbi:MAG: carbon-nitrogen hydrolase family protein [Actinomycetota bacterium]